MSLRPGPGPAAGENSPLGRGDTGAAHAGPAPGGRNDRPDNPAGAGLGNTVGAARGNTAGAGPGNTGDLSQEEILDLVVAATLAEGDPPPADAGLEDGDDGDDWDPRGLPGGGAGAAAPPGWGFEADGAFDVLRPGPMLSEVADAAHVRGLRSRRR